MAFRRKMDEATTARGGKPLSKATILQTLKALRAFMIWLAGQPGYRSRLRYSDADYFRLSEKDTQIAKTQQNRPVPTPEEIEAVLKLAPIATVLERRNRAMIAFTWLTGVRDGALVSLNSKHVNLAESLVDQDAREVNTKNSKSQRTTFFGVGGCARQVVEEWIAELIDVHLFENDDPLFSATLMEQGPDRQFRASGIARKQWPNADAVRKIFRQAFEAIGMHGFKPHSFRHALALLGESMPLTPEEMKAWSQNLGHEKVLTTFTSYGNVQEHRQAEIIRSLANRPAISDRTALARTNSQI